MIKQEKKETLIWENGVKRIKKRWKSIKRLTGREKLKKKGSNKMEFNEQLIGEIESNLNKTTEKTINNLNTLIEKCNEAIKTAIDKRKEYIKSGDLNNSKKQQALINGAREDIENYKEMLENVSKVKVMENDEYEILAKKIEQYYFTEIKNKSEELLNKFLEIKERTLLLNKLEEQKNDIALELYTQAEWYENKYRKAANVYVDEELINIIINQGKGSIENRIKNQIEKFDIALE